MAQLSKHHRELNDDGIGKCSVPMFCGGMDAGFCNEPAYGNRPPGITTSSYAGSPIRLDGRYEAQLVEQAAWEKNERLDGVTP